MRSLLSINVKNFLSLRSIDVGLQDLSVLVGPNGAGKSNLLKVIQFLGDTARLDLGPAIQMHGGYERLAFRGDKKAPRITLGITGLFTPNSSLTAPDEYQLSFSQSSATKSSHIFSQRREEFVFKRTAGRGRRITVSGNKVEIQRKVRGESDQTKQMSLSNTSAGLSTLPRLGIDDGGAQINTLAELLTTFRIFEVDTKLARMPSIFDSRDAQVLKSDASNLASFLYWLSQQHQDVFAQLVEDLHAIAPSVGNIVFVKIGGTDDDAVALKIKEHGVVGLTNMSEASFGTIRAMALLAMLHDPNPPKITCVEEIDHGLHPHALDRIVERLRSASERTQLLVVTHSPALANRLQPKELIVCERDYETGASIIPAVDSDMVSRMAKESDLSLGELWFSGVLGGGL